jgi:RNA-binding signal recognition particle 68
VLFLAERAWSQSSTLKNAHEDATGKRKHHTHRRLNKAVHYAEQLSSLLQTEGVHVDTVSLLEARAYAASLGGQYAFESKRWEVAVRYYSISKVVLETLLSKADETTRLIYREYSALIDPGLRYCAYQLHLPNPADILALAITHLPRDEVLLANITAVNSTILETTVDKGPSKDITSIQWRRRTALITNPEIAVQLAKLREVQAAFTARVATSPASATANLMDEVLNAWAETEDTVKKVMEENVGMSQDKEQSLQVVLTYVSYQVICERVKRDLLLVKELERRKVGGEMAVLKDLVRLHDSVIQVVRRWRG